MTPMHVRPLLQLSTACASVFSAKFSPAQSSVEENQPTGNDTYQCTSYTRLPIISV